MAGKVESGAYLFQGSFLVIPGAMGEGEIARGLDRKAVESSFGGAQLSLYQIPGFSGGETIPAYTLNVEAPIPPSWRTVPLRQAVSAMAGTSPLDGRGNPGRLLRAYHIIQWRKDSAFCGSCGGANGDAPGELARLCPACGRLEFPRISPAVIALVIRDDGRALLAHNKKFNRNVYSLIAGFTEAGENLEAAVAREVEEEAGLAVRDIRYAGSQPWPFPNSLMIGFTARYAGGRIRPDGEEIADARWFSRDSLPELPGRGSVSRYIIDRWIEGKPDRPA
ncbi:MAG: NAD(+) diphosphatase [Treponema sp.]|jgi:NAD+ diphosphatase|nr:NAD(+) diphosphatase [Treponema sp.]